MGFVDLHAHVLPGVDDGPPDLPTALAMLQGLAGLGYERVCATPHQKEGQFLPAAAAIESAHRQVIAALAAARVPLTLGLAAENYWDQVFFERVRDGSLPRYDGGRAFLFEIPPSDVPARFEDALFHIATRGWFPVLAHPERFRALTRDGSRLERLARSCALVVDLGALAGRDGFFTARVARRLVAHRIAHAAASDVHSPSDVRVAAEGIAWIRKKLGSAAVTRLLDENPRRILAGELPD